MVSVIILNYNTFGITARCVESVYQKTEGIEFEVILVDQASEDEDPDKFRLLFPRIKLIASKVNGGFSRGNNLGIAEAKGEYILLLNSDTILINNAIKLACEKLESDASIGALSSMLITASGELQYPAERFPSLGNELREFFRMNKGLSEEIRSRRFLGGAFNHLVECEADWIWGAFFMTRREVIVKLGGRLPDEYFMYAEDMDWCWKIKKLGYRIWYSPLPRVTHLGGGSMPSQGELEKYFTYMFPNRYRVVSRNRSPLYAWSLYFVRALHHLTLRKKVDFWQAKKYLCFLFGRRRYWLNEYN